MKLSEGLKNMLYKLTLNKAKVGMNVMIS